MQNKQTKLRKVTIDELKNEKFIRFRINEEQLLELNKLFNLDVQFVTKYVYIFIGSEVNSISYTNPAETNYFISDYERIELVDTKHETIDKNVFYIDGLQCTTKDAEQILKPLKEEYARSVIENKINDVVKQEMSNSANNTSNISEFNITIIGMLQSGAEELVKKLISDIEANARHYDIKQDILNKEPTEKVREQFYHLAKDYLFDVYYQQRDNIIETNVQNNTGSSLPTLPSPPTLEEILECARVFSANIRVD